MSSETHAVEDRVSLKTTLALESAMERLFAGKSQRTDGRLTKENLWREAQVSRATMNRAAGILARWDEHIAQYGKTTPGEARRDEEITSIRRKLADKTQECTALKRKLQAAATAIAALHHDNQALREELGRHGGTVLPLRRGDP